MNEMGPESHMNLGVDPDSDAERLPSDPARRRLLKQAGVGLAVAWTAPIILSSHVPAAAATPLCTDCTQDVMVNGGAETNTFAGWNSLFGGPEIGQYGAAVVAPVVSPPQPIGPPAPGSYFFRGTSLSNTFRIARFVQDYVFPAVCVTEFAAHPTGTFTLDLEAYLGGQDVPLGDRSQAEVALQQRTGVTILSTTTLGPFSNGYGLQSLTGVPLNSATTAIRLRVVFTRTRGNGPNNAWADNISLTLNC